MNPEGTDLGPRIRHLRRLRAWTVDDLAARSGVSRAMISEVERGLKNPTVKVAYQIARALDTTLSDLLEEVEEPEIAVVRRSDRKTLVEPESGIRRELLSPSLVPHGIEVLHYHLPPGQTTDVLPPNRQGVREHITVQRGKLECQLGERTLALEEGDSVSYGVMPTQYTNRSVEDCEFLLLVLSPNNKIY